MCKSQQITKAFIIRKEKGIIVSVLGHGNKKKSVKKSSLEILFYKSINRYEYLKAVKHWGLL